VHDFQPKQFKIQHQRQELIWKILPKTKSHSTPGSYCLFWWGDFFGFMFKKCKKIDL